MPGDRQHEPRQVARAAGAREPRAALVLAERQQRVRIEEAIARERQPREHRVVDRALVDVEVLAVLLEQEHPVVPQRVRDGRARLRVRRVRQVVVGAEALPRAGGADAARQVELARRRRCPRGGRGR